MDDQLLRGLIAHLDLSERESMDHSLSSGSQFSDCQNFISCELMMLCVPLLMVVWLLSLLYSWLCRSKGRSMFSIVWRLCRTFSGMGLFGA